MCQYQVYLYFYRLGVNKKILIKLKISNLESSQLYSQLQCLKDGFH